MGFSLLFLVLIILLFLQASIKVINEYERAVVLRLGKFHKVKGPGLILLIPVIDKMRKIDLRTVTLDVPPQEVITRDNVSIRVSAVVYFRDMDTDKA
ncbi:MAG: SPFH domain-containing protein, partial [bacterium]